jgi:hypothetical protein
MVEVVLLHRYNNVHVGMLYKWGFEDQEYSRQQHMENSLFVQL